MKAPFVPLAVLALSACTHGGQWSDPGVSRTETAVPMPEPAPLPEVPNSAEALEIASIEASVDSALRPLSEKAPVRLTPAVPDTPALKPLTAAASRVCRAREQTPAVYEQVMGEVQVVQAVLAPDGTVLRPPVYRKGPVPRIVRPRAEISFEAPCPEQMTPDFVASLQRALGARGYFAGNVTGQMDAPTAAALKRYQAERGLDSAQLSLETARALGLVAVGNAG
ncbi:peptidoglycan-binding domain-containing protein [Pacificoceanicola onchidii]|uniref:peptidoglycan-binding domain-containing protein n=1 Tax=Pacificoceanicola onchidii TaxID=2562685 RepID=UPI001F0F255A|nr:peptidoglycan-binding domain-containing protein [Pacificoceanicola onchidii]